MVLTKKQTSFKIFEFLSLIFLSIITRYIGRYYFGNYLTIYMKQRKGFKYGAQKNHLRYGSGFTSVFVCFINDGRH